MRSAIPRSIRRSSRYTIPAPISSSPGRRRKVGELGWKPKFFLANTATSIASVLKPAGVEYAKGIISTAHIQDPTDPTWNDDPAVKKWREFMDKYYPDGGKGNSNNGYAAVGSQGMMRVLWEGGV